MKFGYMSGFRGDLFEEIEFAKKHFDFTEITILPELLKNIDAILSDLIKAISGFEVLGHVHWEITEFEDIIKNVEVLKNLGAQKVTLHPFKDLSIEANAQILTKINEYLLKNKMELLLENVSKVPYNYPDSLLKLLELIPEANLTLDIGHANRIYELDNFFNKLKSKIHHIHLHDNIGDSDHLFFEDKNKMEKALNKIKSLGYDGTVLLETFSIIKDGKSVSQEFAEIKKLHIEQLKQSL